MPQTRKQRFLVLRDAIMAHKKAMRVLRPGEHELLCGPFKILYMFEGGRHGRGYNLNIWPGAKQWGGMTSYDHKVANVDWNERDEVDILSYRSGPWEAELLSLLSNNSTVPRLRSQAGAPMANFQPQRTRLR